MCHCCSVLCGVMCVLSQISLHTLKRKKEKRKKQERKSEGNKIREERCALLEMNNVAKIKGKKEEEKSTMKALRLFSRRGSMMFHLSFAFPPSISRSRQQIYYANSVVIVLRLFLSFSSSFPQPLSSHPLIMLARSRKVQKKCTKIVFPFFHTPTVGLFTHLFCVIFRTFPPLCINRILMTTNFLPFHSHFLLSRIFPLLLLPFRKKKPSFVCDIHLLHFVVFVIIIIIIVVS